MVLVIPRINIKKITQKHTKRKMRRVSKQYTMIKDQLNTKAVVEVTGKEKL